MTINPGHLMLAKWNDWKTEREMKRRFYKIVKAASKEDFICRVALPELNVHWRTMSVPAVIRGLDMYVSPEMLGFSMTKAVLVMLHEVRHLAYDHDKRTMALYTFYLCGCGLKPSELQKVIKLCADAEINRRLVAMGYDLEPYGMVHLHGITQNASMESMVSFVLNEKLKQIRDLLANYSDGME